MNRREFLKFMGAGGLALASGDAVMRALAAMPAGAFAPVPVEGRDPVAYVISRLTYGPTPDLYDYVHRIGVEAYLEEQLAPESIDDSALRARLESFDLLNQPSAALIAQFEVFRQQRKAAKTAGEKLAAAAAAGSPLNLYAQLAGAALMRGVYSKRQLYEQMVEFWGDHFNIYAGQQQALLLKPADDRDAIRPNALGMFRALLGASAHSPAMLVYLDNAESSKDGPNENYGRELMELHTLSRDGGYSEDDVRAVARAFTGWSVARPFDIGHDAGTYLFRARRHDNDAKTVLGVQLPANGGAQDGEIVLDILAAHPSTAKFITTKLARRFVSDNPPPALLALLAATFTESRGDIRAVLRAIFSAPEFWNADNKLKRPLGYTIGLLRALSYDTGDPNKLLRALRGPLTSLGQLPFYHLSPNGYPDVSGAWANNLLARWNLALAAAGGRIGSAQADRSALTSLATAQGAKTDPASLIGFAAQYLFGRPLNGVEQDTVQSLLASVSGDEQQIRSGLALLLASPAFQYR